MVMTSTAQFKPRAFPVRPGIGSRLSPDDCETLVYVLVSGGQCEVAALGRAFADGQLGHDRATSSGLRRTARLVRHRFLARLTGTRDLHLTEAGRIAAALALAKDAGLRAAYFDEL